LGECRDCNEDGDEGEVEDDRVVRGGGGGIGFFFKLGPLSMVSMVVPSALTSRVTVEISFDGVYVENG
jgi:hypothetical protein